MEVVTYEAAHADGVAACFNRLVEGAPHCFPATAERLDMVMQARDPERQEMRRVQGDRAWVACEGGKVVGFAQSALQAPDDECPEPRGSLRFLAYDAGERRGGQALVEAVEAHYREGGVSDVIAFHQDDMWPCYHFPHAYLSDRLSHVHALLGANGYARAAGEIYWEWRDLEPPEVAASEVEVALRTERRADGTRHPSFVLRAFRGNAQVAQCWCTSCGSRAPGSEAEEWCLTTWLEVEEGFRGRHLGAHVLAAALGQMRELGFRHAAISTSWTNWRAQLFYSNFGYRASDWTYALGKRLA